MVSAEFIRIGEPDEARALAALLNDGERTRPVAVVSTPRGRDEPWIDAQRIAADVGQLAVVYVLPTGDCSWAFSAAMAPTCQAYGGAGRVYPVGVEWVHDFAASRLRFAYSAADGPRATERLIADVLVAASDAGLLDTPRLTTALREVVGEVVGCPTDLQAMVKLREGYATIQVGLAFPRLTASQVFRPGMHVRGLLDPDARRLDVRPFLPVRDTAFAGLSDGDVVLAVVDSVYTASCVIRPHPQVPVTVSREQVTGNDLDDLRDLLSTDEVVGARLHRRTDGALALTLLDVDDDDTPHALSLLPGGPPWLRPPASADDSQQETADLVDHAREPEAEQADDLEIVLPAPAPSPETAPRPTPLLLDAGRGTPPQPALPRKAAGRSNAVRDLGLQLDAARARVHVLEADVARATQRLRDAEAEIILLRRELIENRTALEHRDNEVRRLKQRHRESLRQRRVQTPQPTQFFTDPEEQLRWEIQDAWVRRIPAPDKSRFPLRPYRVGPRFLESLGTTQGIERAKVVDVLVEVLTGLADGLDGRDMHPLRTGTAGGDPVIRRDAYTCWRVALQRNTPSARRLHFWRSADDIELSRVVLHDDFQP